MEKKFLAQQMQAYGQWKERLIDGIEHYRKWLDKYSMSSPEDELRIFEILGNLRTDRLTIAFVAEFARGKTELINAIFFSEYDRRLLPSEAGRTTMCPTELFYDANEDHSYIRLLPIETRLSDVSIGEYKQDPIQWTTMKLDLNDPDSMAEAFKEVVSTKTVSVEDALKLGLYSDADKHLHSDGGNDPTHIKIPMWRHALISFPHPLLKSGLVILDTPGLNALGSEPELTLKMLPNAQAVLFVMAADTGVTKSDLDMWTLNVKPLRDTKHAKGVIVVLNKIDTLWDDLKSLEHVNASITSQCEAAAKTLGIPAGSVIPASAQKGLLAKIRHDPELIERSNIATLEEILSNEVIPSQQELVREHVKAEMGAMIKQSHSLMVGKLNSTKKQLIELHGLSGKNSKVIEHLMQKTREEQVSYHENVKSFNMNKKLLSQQSKELLDLLSLTRLDQLVSTSRSSMSDSWSTMGLKNGMKTLFDGINKMFEDVIQYSEQLNKQVTTLFQRFHEEHDVPEIAPVLYTPEKYHLQLLKLYKDAEEFRTSPVTTLTEQSFVIKKFFINLVSHARNIYFEANRDADKWSKDALNPLVKQIREHKVQMEARLENLRKVSQSHGNLNGQMDKLRLIGEAQKRQYEEVHDIYRIIADSKG